MMLAAAALTVASCQDKLDEVPDNRTEIDSPSKVASLLTSGYPDHTAAVILELSGDNYVDDNVVVPATHNDAYQDFHEEAYKWVDINNYSMGAQDTPYSVWQAYYGGIAVCNHAITAMKEMCPGIETMSAADIALNFPEVSPSWGEAMVLRAYLHFMLVNIFAEAYKNDQLSLNDVGIPYVVEPESTVYVDYGDSQYLHNVKETYDLIERDLLAGLPLINDAQYKVGAYHFNRNAANAFAARFYLFKRDYAKCIQYADVALGSNPSSMLRKWSSLNTNTIESRLLDYNDETAPCNFMIQSTYSVQDRMLSACRYAINSGSTFTQDGQTWTVPSTLDIIYEGGGPNWSGYVPAYSGNLFIFGGQQYGVWLFTVYEYFEYTDKIAGIGYVHMLYHPFTAEETLLCRAEAKLYQGDRNGAIQDLGFWTNSKLVTSPLNLAGIQRKYSRAGRNQWCSPLHPAEMGFEKVLTGDDLAVLDCVLHFRRIETMFEGMRWFDIKRYGITVYHHYRGANEDAIHTDSLTYNDPRRVLQLPKNVIDAGYPANRGTSGAMGGGGSSSSMVHDQSKAGVLNPMQLQTKKMSKYKTI
jgi:hypothetical protein